MIKLISVIGFVALLSGCGYDQSELMAAKVACDAQSGELKLSINGSKSVVGAYCIVDGIQYKVGRTRQVFSDATVVK